MSSSPANGQLADRNPNLDPVPVVKLFTPMQAPPGCWPGPTPEDPDIAFGLCDLGLGFPELGTVRIPSLRKSVGAWACRLSVTGTGTGQHPISVYAKKAWAAERIVS